MEPAESQVIKSTDRNVRLQLLLGKYPVVKIERTALGFAFGLKLPNNVVMVVQAPPTADVREGDILTLYTEVLANANSSQTPKQ